MERRRLGPGFWWKLAGLGILDAVVVALIPALIDSGANVALVSIIIGAIGINYVFLSPRAYALRWLVPGVVFMTLMLIWPLIFTVFIATTNWSTGNFLSQDQAIERLTEGALISPDDATPLDLLFYRDEAGTVFMWVQNPDTGDVFYGEPRLATDPAPEAPTLVDLATAEVIDDNDDGLPEAVDGAPRLLLADISSIAGVDNFILDIPIGEARVRTLPSIGAGSARLAINRFTYDPATEAMFDNLNNQACFVEDARFVCGGQAIDPGWREFIGLENFANLITDERFRTPFLRVFVWNVTFAAVVVALQFGIGLLLALTFQNERMRGRKFYRSLLIIPYAAPAFIAVIVWRGLLNRTFGPVNRLLEPVFSLVGSDFQIPWLNDPFWAKMAVILVTVWQGFPYFFLIASGALQSIPPGLQEAAKVDGAGPIKVFRTITFPLLLVSIAPLLIASFAFNFNNFVNVFLLTSGGPPITGFGVPVGETDLLITFTFNLAIESGRGGQFALASALTFFIFFIVATISAISFRFTRRLESVYGNV